MKTTIPQSIDKVIEAISEIPFQDWSTRELQAVPLTILESMKFEYDSQERLKCLIDAQLTLSREVSKSYSAVNQNLKNSVQSAVYYGSGVLKLDGDIDPIQDIKALSKTLQGDRK